MAATNNSDQLVVGGTGTIWVAPVGTPLPTTPTATPNSLFLSLGYTTEDGVKFTDERTLAEINAWQSFYPVRRIITGRNATVEFTLEEWDRKSISLAFGGGTWSSPSAGVYKYAPPSPSTIDTRAMIIDVVDGTENYRILIPQGMVTSNTETTFSRTGASLLPITFGVVGQDAVDPWDLLTDSTAADAIIAGS